MAKKKDLPDMTNMGITDLIRFIVSLPKEEQQQMLELMDMIESTPDEEKEDLLVSLLSRLNDDVDFDEDVEDKDDEDDVEDVDNYPHFLPRKKVEKYTLRVTLQGIKPPVYRKFVVPSNISLRHLSELLLELMGWYDMHLNQFRKGDNYYAPAYQRENELPVMFGRARNFNQEDYALSDILSEKGKGIEWEYDFGDSWCHDVHLSSVGEYKVSESLVSFVKGERACPPEDCGGVWGYAELLELRAKKEAHKRLTAEEKEQLEWYELDDLKDPMSSPEFFDDVHAQEICECYCV